MLELLKELKLNLGNPYNVMIYLSGIILVSSLIFMPQQIDIKWLRVNSLSIILTSVIFRTVADIIDALATFELQENRLTYQKKIAYSVAHIVVILVYFVVTIVKLTLFG